MGCSFFYAPWEIKNKILRFDWMNGLPTFTHIFATEHSFLNLSANKHYTCLSLFPYPFLSFRSLFNFSFVPFLLFLIHFSFPTLLSLPLLLSTSFDLLLPFVFLYQILYLPLLRRLCVLKLLLFLHLIFFLFFTIWTG